LCLARAGVIADSGAGAEYIFLACVLIESRYIYKIQKKGNQLRSPFADTDVLKVQTAQLHQNHCKTIFTF